MNLFGVLSDAFPLLLKGLGMTVRVTVISLVFAVVIGIINMSFQAWQKSGCCAGC